MDKFTEKFKNISRRWRLCGCGDVCRCLASRVSRRALSPGGQRRNWARLVTEEADENPPTDALVPPLWRERIYRGRWATTTLEGKNIIGGDGKPCGMETALWVPPSRLDAHSGYLNPIAEPCTPTLLSAQGDGFPRDVFSLTTPTLILAS